MKIVVAILVVVIVALVVGFVPIIEAQDTEPLSYETQSQIEKSDNRALRTMILSTVAFEKDPAKIQEALDLAYSFPEFNPVGHLTVRNTDTVQGVFKVEITFRLGDKEEIAEFVLELKPGEREAVKMSADVHYDHNWTWDYEVTPDTKLVCVRVPIFEYLLCRFGD